MARLTNSEIDALLRDLRQALEPMYGARLRELYLFGSYARGDADEESDVDVLIVLDQVGSYGREVDTVGGLISRLSLQYGVSVIPVFAAEAEWRKGDRLFLAAIRGEVRAA